MAAPKQRPWRSLGVIAVTLVALYLGVFLGPAQKPALGLDLRGGTEVTLRGSGLCGQAVTKTAIDQAVDIIRNRVNGLGVGGATVNAQGKTDIVVAVPGKGRDEVLKTVGKTALLRFRQVLAIGSAVPAPVTTSSASPSSSPSPSHSASSGHRVSKKPAAKSSKSSSSGMALSSVLENKSPAPTPSATPSTTGAVAPAATSTTPAPTPTPTSTSTTSSGGGCVVSGSEGSSGQSADLATAEKAFASLNCAKDPNPTRGADVPSNYIIACDPTGPNQAYKYLLDKAAIEGTQVKSAGTSIGTTGAWQVNLNFNGSGSTDWYNLTKKAFESTGSATTGYPTCAPPKGCNAVAIVLDGVVQSAPYSETDGIPGGSAQISGSFSQSDANQLADVLKYGSLPLKFTTQTAQSVSASLGQEQLRGGLIAGLIGLVLVIVFSLLYYRALGLVTVGSLAVSGLILYAVTTLLGHSSVGYTLSLPGIAGFIVAIGITADSFVVFFERIRDEIREGRRLRSGVERAWPRARRTILSADTVSLLAAVILYAVSIGDVRGFAFTLGLSTLSDLFIVFLFTKPLLTLLARNKAFDSGAWWTGIGHTRAGVERDEEERAEPRPRSPRTREA